MNHQQISNLNTLLMQGISLLESLDAVYDEELNALSSQDLDALKESTDKKNKLLAEFHQFTQDRVDLVRSFGLKVESDNYKVPDEVIAAEPRIEQHHQKIKQLLKELQQKNKRNEQIVVRGQQNVAQLLSIIRGQTAQDKLYNNKGSTGLYKAQSRLGKA